MMKCFAACLVFAATLVSSATVPLRRDTPRLGPDTVPGFKVLPPPLFSGLFDKNGKLQPVLSNPAGVEVPKATVPDVQVETPIHFPDASRKKMRYGPFRLPGIKEINWQSKAMNLSGMADEYIPYLAKPCSECMLASVNADLEYANGTVTGPSAWLHHSVLITAGPKIRDPICNSSNTETIFSSGNERSVTRYSYQDSKIKAAYRLRAEDTITLVGEFKNELPVEQWIWLTVAYEYYDGPRPDWKDTHIAWLNVGKSSCDPKAVNPFGASNLTSKGVPKTLKFEEATIPWTSPVDATLYAVGGHLHDGGEAIDIYQNSQKICEAKPTYGAGAGGMSHGEGEHIKSMSNCRMMKPIKAGDTFWLIAKYDLTKHAGGRTDTGDLDEVMGIGTVLFLTEPKS